ncbi:unnamed protein product [Urochloa humidicola]
MGSAAWEHHPALCSMCATDVILSTTSLQSCAAVGIFNTSRGNGKLARACPAYRCGSPVQLSHRKHFDFVYASEALCPCLSLSGICLVPAGST